MYISFYHQINARIDMEQLLMNPNFTNVGPRWVTITGDIRDVGADARYTVLKNHIGPLPNLLPAEPQDFTYKTFFIPKKGNPNKLRRIDEPNPELKNYLRTIKIIFEDKLKFISHNAAHAYVPKRSVVTAMQEHQKNESRWFLKIDVKDFFPKHNKAFIMQQMSKVFPFACMLKDEEDKQWLERWVDYSLLNDGLPQGTPLSPLMTNITMVPIDAELSYRLGQMRDHFIYTRYADDIIISCKVSFDAEAVVNLIKHVFAMNNTPFAINEDKTRYGSRNGRNWNLGVMLNKDNKMTIGYRDNHKFRATLFKFFKDNLTDNNQWSMIDVQKLVGNVSWYMSVQPEITSHYIEIYNQKFQNDFWALSKELLR